MLERLAYELGERHTSLPCCSARPIEKRPLRLKHDAFHSASNASNARADASNKCYPDHSPQSLVSNHWPSLSVTTMLGLKPPLSSILLAPPLGGPLRIAQ
jgi:hypothetical protein